MRLVLKGTVQGVGFRPTVYRVASFMRLNGYVKNLGSEVEVIIDGDGDEFLRRLKEELPPLANIESVERYEKDVKREGFHIVKSSQGQRSSTIPVDTALCDDCLEELFSKDDRRRGFSFTNCTNCGARFSTIESLPYDRDKTTMEPFPMCEGCEAEYSDPTDRRFHAQTISCPNCGPEYKLFDKDKNQIGGIDEFCELVKQGDICIAKSWGGMHIVCKLESIPELREKYGRGDKPFALMMPDVGTVKKYARIEREDVLTGSRRPIMIYEKKEDKRELIDLAAPGLPTVGIMLPYTGLHHLIFDKIDADALVMTSANLPGEPMIVDNKKAFELDIDYFLLHNRKIANRIDDSLIRVHKDDLAFIRRSRGYVPEYLDFIDGKVMGAGADQSGCVAFSKDGKIYPSQYLGDLDSYKAAKFYGSAAYHLIHLLGIDDVDAVGIDLHPKYQSRRLGKEFAEEYEADIVEIQHHWAHGASLLLEHQLDDIVCIAVDGTGYGEDGNSWGGEILYCRPESFERKAHLQEFPLIGGDEAVKDPRRSIFAIQNKLGIESQLFSSAKRAIFKKVAENSIVTSSFGRLLDAVSCTLDVSCKRTYEGEPAMKLERLQMEGDYVRDYDVYTEDGVIKTLEGFVQMMDDDARRGDKAASYVSQVSEEIARSAIMAAEEEGTENIGISGGVSYNRPIVEKIKSVLKENGYNLYVHNKIPNGDMGIPMGQAYICANNYSD